jgi:hypothetical protein
LEFPDPRFTGGDEVNSKTLSEITNAMGTLLVTVEQGLEQSSASSDLGKVEADWIELTPDSRDRLATFRRKVLVLQEDWRYLEQDFLSGSTLPPNSEREIERHFSENRSLWLLFQELRQIISQIYPDVVCYANTKWICFKRERNFLIVNALQRHLDSGIAVGENYVHSRLEKRRTKRGYGGWNGWPAEYQGLRIRSATDLDEEFQSLVRYAYESYGLLRGERG